MRTGNGELPVTASANAAALEETPAPASAMSKEASDTIDDSTNKDEKDEKDEMPVPVSPTTIEPLTGVDRLTLENAEWEATYPRSGEHMQGARKNVKARYRGFFDDSGKLKPGMSEYIRSVGSCIRQGQLYSARADVLGDRGFAIGPNYSSKKERDIGEVVVAHLGP